MVSGGFWASRFLWFGVTCADGFVFDVATGLVIAFGFCVS